MKVSGACPTLQRILETALALSPGMTLDPQGIHWKPPTEEHALLYSKGLLPLFIPWSHTLPQSGHGYTFKHPSHIVPSTSLGEFPLQALTRSLFLIEKLLKTHKDSILQKIDKAVQTKDTSRLLPTRAELTETLQWLEKHLGQTLTSGVEASLHSQWRCDRLLHAPGESVRVHRVNSSRKQQEEAAQFWNWSLFLVQHTHNLKIFPDECMRVIQSIPWRSLAQALCSQIKQRLTDTPNPKDPAA